MRTFAVWDGDKRIGLGLFILLTATGTVSGYFAYRGLDYLDRECGTP